MGFHGNAGHCQRFRSAESRLNVPALTVAAGTTPTVGAGATGTIGTITRPDSNGTLQVTYNGVPLYFFSGDHAVGDSNGIYTNWSAVKP